MREIIYGFIVTFSVVVTLQSAHVLYLTMYTYNIRRPRPARQSTSSHLACPSRSCSRRGTRNR
jgi:hypothetical protein